MIKEINSLLWMNIKLEDKDLPTYFSKYADKFWFNVYKVEKDFLLTILLIDFSKNNPELNFKWWTCLNKIYYNYYRLSEDLDFFIINDWWVKVRWHKLDEYKALLQTDKYSKLWLTYVDKPNWTKHHSNRQWCYSFGYKSCFDNSDQTIKIDIRIEKESLYEPEKKEIWSIFEDILWLDYLFQWYSIKVMNINEIASEKVRATLTRTPTPAIRDFFDVWYMREHWVDFQTLSSNIAWKIEDYKETLRNWQKLYTIDDISIEDLKTFMETDLITVLGDTWKRDYDFSKFRLDEILSFVKSFKIVSE